MSVFNGGVFPMRKLFVLGILIIAALSVAACVTGKGKAPIGKGKAPAVVTTKG